MSDTDGNVAQRNSSPILAEIRLRFLDRLVGIVSPVGGFSAAAQEAVRKGSGEFFDQIANNRTRAGFEQAKGLTASKISLIHEDQLELSIRLGEMTRRLTDACAVPLAKLFPRLVTLLDRPEMEEDENPVGLEAVAAGVGEAFAELELKVDQALERLRAIEASLAQELPLLYAKLNEILVSHQIRPANRPSQASEGRRGAAQSSGPDPMAVLQRAIMGRIPAPPGGVGMPGPVGEGPAANFAFTAPSNDLAAAAFNTSLMQQLVGLLQERQLSTVPVDATANTLADLKAGDFGKMVRGQEAATLDTLALLFQAIFDDPSLPDAVKSSIARLQIPLLKAAMIDTGFFSNRSHPARVLLDTMAQAANGLGPDVDSANPVCAELKRIAIAVQTGFKQDVEIFSRHAAELDTFMAALHLDLQRAAEGYIAAGQQQETFDLASIEAARVLHDTDLSVAPPAIADFLRQHWRKVLAQAYIDGGEDGQAWLDARKVVTDLLWTLQPRSDPEDRKHLAVLIPSLLQRLRASLDRASVPAEARTPFFDACLVLQAAALRGKLVVALPNEVADRAYQSASGESVQDIEVDGFRLRSLRLAGPYIAEDGDRVAALTIGDNIEFAMPSGETASGRLTWFSPTLGNPMLTNSAWDHAISIQRSILERQLSEGQARVAGEESLFDAAAEKALQAMVQQQASPRAPS